METRAADYLQVNLYRGQTEWHAVVWIKRPGGRFPRTVRGFPDARTGVPARAPLSRALEELPRVVAAALAPDHSTRR